MTITDKAPLPVPSQTGDNEAYGVEHYASQFDSFISLREMAEPARAAELRKSAMADFIETGFPTRRVEDWKYTSLAPMLKIPFIHAELRPPFEEMPVLVKDGKIKSTYLEDESASRLVFVNGRYHKDCSTTNLLPPGVKVGSIADLLCDDGNQSLRELFLEHLQAGPELPFARLNNALFADGAYVHVPRGMTVPVPLHLLFVSHTESEPIASHPRVFVLAEENSMIDIIELYLGSDESVYFTNSLSDLVVLEGARVGYYKVQQEGLKSFHTGLVRIHPARASQIKTWSVSLGGQLARNEIRTKLEAEGIDCTMNGLYVVNEEQRVDNHTVVDHVSPHCTSNETYKGILNDRSEGAFSGIVMVRPQAQKTDAHQSNKNILLSDDAVAHARPQLQIKADDVRCTHGVAIGHLEEESLFYLQSRGVGREEATSMLTIAFAKEILDAMPFDGLRTNLEESILSKISRDVEAMKP